MTPEELAVEEFRVLNKLTKWRTFFASWQLGSRGGKDGECRAVKNHREATILLRSEVSALVGLLIKKGVFTQVEWTEQVIAEAKALDHAYEENYPGWSSSLDGMHMQMPSARETMQRLGFPR